ncbi:MAG: hypothetical protein ACYC9S_12000 [Leptospirales bacterium]
MDPKHPVSLWPPGVTEISETMGSPEYDRPDGESPLVASRFRIALVAPCSLFTMDYGSSGRWDEADPDRERVPPSGLQFDDKKELGKFPQPSFRTPPAGKELARKSLIHRGLLLGHLLLLVILIHSILAGIDPFPDVYRDPNERQVFWTGAYNRQYPIGLTGPSTTSQRPIFSIIPPSIPPIGIPCIIPPIPDIF